MAKYDVTVTQVNTFTLTVGAPSEAEAKKRAIDLVQQPGTLDRDATIPEVRVEYTATAALASP